MALDLVAPWASSRPRSAGARCRGRRGGADEVRYPNFVYSTRRPRMVPDEPVVPRSIYRKQQGDLTP
jgi:hypothetical protein